MRERAQDIDGLRRQRPEQGVVAAEQEPVSARVARILEHGLRGEDVPVDVVEHRQRRHSLSNTIEAVEVLGPTLTLRYASDADARSLLLLGADPEVTKFFSWGPYRRSASHWRTSEGSPGSESAASGSTS